MRHVNDGAATSRRATEARLFAVVQRGRARRHAYSDAGRRLDRPPAGVPPPAGQSERQRRRGRQRDGEEQNTQRHCGPTRQSRLVSHATQTRTFFIDGESGPTFINESSLRILVYEMSAAILTGRQKQTTQYDTVIDARLKANARTYLMKNKLLQVVKLTSNQAACSTAVVIKAYA